MLTTSTSTSPSPSPPLLSCASSSYLLNPMSAPARKFPAPCWTHDETVALIDAYRDKWYSLRRGNLRAADWDAVAAAVSLRYHLAAPSKTSVQCRHKIEKLRQRYRAEKQRSAAYPGGFCSSWAFFANMDSMDRGSHTGQAAVTPISNIDFDGNKFHLKSSPNPGWEQGGFDLKSAGDGGLLPPGYRANSVSNAIGGFPLKAPIGRNLESFVDGHMKADLDFNGNADDREDAERRFRLKMQGVRSKNYGMMDVNYHSNLCDDMNGGDGLGVFTQSSGCRNNGNRNSNPEVEGRDLKGCSGLLRLGFGKVSGEGRGMKREIDPVSEMVSSIRLLGEGFVKMEKMKLEMAREIEKTRMEMEMKRCEMMLDTQRQIVDALVKGFLKKKKAKKVLEM